MPAVSPNDPGTPPQQSKRPARASSALNKLGLGLRLAKGAKTAQLAATVVKIKVLGGVALALLVIAVVFLIVVGMSVGLSAEGVLHAQCGNGEQAATLAPGGGILVGASEYGGPGDPGTKGDKGSFIAHLTGHIAYAELGLSGPSDPNWQDAHKLGDALGSGRALPPHTKLQITANGHSVIAEKLDVGAGGGPVGSPPRERAIDLWYQTAAALGLDSTNSGQWSGLVRVQLTSGTSVTATSEPVASNGESATASRAPSQPQIISNPIPFGQKRKDEMRAYALRHYGIDSYELQAPKVIVEHFTETHTWQEAYNTFAPDVPDPELHELPGTTSHFIIDQNGGIHQVLPLNLMGRHTVGLNYTAVGIEMVGMSDQEILNRPTELDAALSLTRWLQSKYGISTSNVIGHNESLTSPYHRENIARLRTQTHNDWNKADMNVFRSKLAYEPPSGASAENPGASGAACEGAPTEASAESGLGTAIVQIAQSQLGQGEHPPGSNCTMYSSTCEAWCSDFLTWVWHKAGVEIPHYPASNDVYTWGEKHTHVLPPTATPAPGDAIEFGTGPQSTATSVHVAIVEQVFSNGEITYIGGNNSKDEVGRSKPFQPSQAAAVGMVAPVYGYVVP
ncbi:MAG TPA: N-acetylmuramoyl-L-alanine amidase [Solirubrobacteraceae bacterium]|jgi:beta-N-acetylhexosaminidase